MEFENRVLHGSCFLWAHFILVMVGLGLKQWENCCVHMCVRDGHEALG